MKRGVPIPFEIEEGLKVCVSPLSVCVCLSVCLSVCAIYLSVCLEDH